MTATEQAIIEKLEVIATEIQKGSKASKARARKATIDAEKLFKTFRKESVAEGKA